MTHRFPAPAAPLFACLLAVACAAHAGKAVRYTVTDLGPDSAVSSGISINVKGLVAGSKAGRAALFGIDGTFTDLGALGGRYSGASSINGKNVVAGSADTAVPGVAHAFRYAKGRMTDLGTLSTLPSANSAASDINEAGDIVGSSDTDSGARRAFLYRQGQLTDIGTLPGDTDAMALAVNRLGHVVGQSYTPFTFTGHAFFQRDGQMTPLGAFAAGRFSSAHAINDTDQITGAATSSPAEDAPWTAFFYSGGVMKDLGVARSTDVNSIGLGINSAGVVVGYSAAVAGASTVAFVYDGKTTADLNTRIPADSGWVLDSAYGINDKGQITGSGYHDGVRHAYRLTPVSTR